MFVTRFVAEGKGQFPTDMLRYDSCYPADPDAVAEITVPFERLDFGITRTVTLSKKHKYQKDAGITVERWRSFGWNVEILQTWKID